MGEKSDEGAIGRRVILDVARRIIDTRGYEELSVVAVARAAGVPRSTVYRLFGDRRGLLGAVIEHGVEELLGRLTTSIPTEAGLDQMLAIGVSVFLDFVEERRPEYELLFGHTGRLDPDVAVLFLAVRENLAETYRTLFKPVLERARGDIWSDDESMLVTHAVMALAEGAAVAWVAHGTLPKARVVEIVVQMIRDALVGRGHGRATVRRRPAGRRTQLVV